MTSILTPGLQGLSMQHSDGGFYLVVETPQGSPCKLKFEPDRGIFTLSHMLTAGAVYPHDWGYIPGTLGPDGDPVDAFPARCRRDFPGAGGAGAAHRSASGGAKREGPDRHLAPRESGLRRALYAASAGQPGLR
jgi:inorganic pyrophosphatase